MNSYGPISYGGITLHYINDMIQPDFFNKTPHSHDHCEIFIHEKGDMNVFVEKTVYRHTGKEIRVYAPNELHLGSCCNDQPMEWYQISVSRSFFEKNSALCGVIINREYGTHNVFTSKKHGELVALATEIIEKKKSNSPLLESYFWGNITRILCLLNEKSNNIDIGIKQNESLKEIIRIIDNNYVSISSSSDLCRLTHFSASYIHRLFKSYLNTTPHQFILIKKLNRACELLSAGATVSEACYDSGFNNYPNFITLFRKNYGLTPNKYRSKIMMLKE